MKRNLLLLAASICLALAFILSCSSSDDPVLPVIDGGGYPKSTYCVYGGSTILDCTPTQAGSADLEAYLKKSCEDGNGTFFTSLPPSCTVGYPKNTYCVYGENTTIDCMPTQATSAELEAYLEMNCKNGGGAFFTSLPPSCAGGGGSSNSGGGSSSSAGDVSCYTPYDYWCGEVSSESECKKDCGDGSNGTTLCGFVVPSCDEASISVPGKYCDCGSPTTDTPNGGGCNQIQSGDEACSLEFCAVINKQAECGIMFENAYCVWKEHGNCHLIDSQTSYDSCRLYGILSNSCPSFSLNCEPLGSDWYCPDKPNL